MMLEMILATSRMSRTEMETRQAVSELLKSIVFLFLITMLRKSRLRNNARNEMTDHDIHHQIAAGTT